MDYRDTLNLPKTTFNMKASLIQKEPQYLARWDQERLYAKLQQAAADRPLFILHDGPPYANGNIHLGTAFNKVLKVPGNVCRLAYHCDHGAAFQGKFFSLAFNYSGYAKEGYRIFLLC